MFYADFDKKCQRAAYFIKKTKQRTYSFFITFFNMHKNKVLETGNGLLFF